VDGRGRGEEGKNRAREKVVKKIRKYSCRGEKNIYFKEERKIPARRKFPSPPIPAPSPSLYNDRKNMHIHL